MVGPSEDIRLECGRDTEGGRQLANRGGVSIDRCMNSSSSSSVDHMMDSTMHREQQCRSSSDEGFI